MSMNRLESGLYILTTTFSYPHSRSFDSNSGARDQLSRSHDSTFGETDRLPMRRIDFRWDGSTFLRVEPLETTGVGRGGGGGNFGAGIFIFKVLILYRIFFLRCTNIFFRHKGIQIDKVRLEECVWGKVILPLRLFLIMVRPSVTCFTPSYIIW